MKRLEKSTISKILILTLLVNIFFSGIVSKKAYALAPNTISFNADPFVDGYASATYDVGTTDFGDVTFKATDDPIETSFNSLSWTPGQKIMFGNTYNTYYNTVYKGDLEWKGLTIGASGTTAKDGRWLVFGTKNRDTKFSFKSFKIGEMWKLFNSMEVVGFCNGSKVASQTISITKGSKPTTVITMDSSFGYVDEIRMHQNVGGNTYPGFEGIIVNDFVLDDPIILAPTVLGISPSSGSAAGGSSVKITGTNLSGATAVNFGSNAGIITANSATEITATAPSGSVGTVHVTVTTAGGTSSTSSADQFTYVATSAAPSAGDIAVTNNNGVDDTAVVSNLVVGDVVKVYDSLTGGILLGTSPAVASGQASATVTIAQLGSGAGNVYVTVTSTGKAESTPRTVKAYGAESLLPSAPTVTGISPTSGPVAGGTSITITGTNLSGATAVMFGTNPAVSYTVTSDTQITATSPSGSVGTVHVTVTTAGGTSSTSSADQFNYLSPPSVTSHPSNSAVTAGNDTSFTVGAVGTGLTYKWQVNTGSGFVNIANGGVYSGATTASLNITGATIGMNGYLYRAVVSGSVGSPVNSNGATLTVNPAATTVTAGNNSVSGSTGSITVGGSVTLIAVGDRQSIATGTVIGDERYIPTTWISTESGKIGTFTISGGNYTSTYTTSTVGSYTITAIFERQTWNGTTWVAGITDSKTTTLTVNPAAVAPSITSQPVDETIIEGQDANFSVTAVGSAPLNYQWKKGGVNLVGKTSSTLVLNNVQKSDEGSYTVEISNSVGSITSDEAILTVNPAPSSLIIGTSNPPDGTVGIEYSGHTFTSTGGIGSKTYAVTDGSIPAGLTLALDGNLTGTPTSAGTSTFEVTVTDSLSAVSSHTFNMKIKESVISTEMPVKIMIGGTTRVGNTLSAQLLDANGSVTTTSSAVTYTWYRLDSSNSADGKEIGSGETYQLVNADARKYIKLIAEFDDKKFEYITSQISEKSSNNSSSSSSRRSSNSSKSEEIKADVTDGSSNSISQTKVERITTSDGTKKDTVNYTENNAQETVKQLAKGGKDTARIVIPDPKNEVSETKVNIPRETLSTLSSGNVNLEINTENARISLPKQTIQDLSQNWNEDLYFRLMPIKDAAKKQEIQANANREAVMQVVSGINSVQELGKPMAIETNMSGREVHVTLPLKDINIPVDSTSREAFLNDLGIYIEHSDGTKEFVKGEIVEYSPGVYGIKFTVTKFSNFTIVKLDQRIAGQWVNSTEGWKYIKNGQPLREWNLINGSWYLMNSTGIMQTGWQQINSIWYYLNSSGAMVTGWVQTNDTWYYLYSNGSMASNTTIEGYTLNTSGAWIS